MKSMLTAFAALAALALPAGLPTLAMAQDVVDDVPANNVGARFQADGQTAPSVQMAPQERPPVQRAEDQRGGDRGERGGNRGGGEDGARGDGGNRGGQNGSGRNRGDGQGRGDRDRGAVDRRAEDDRWNRNTPSVTPGLPPPVQDGGQGRDRGGNARDWNGGRGDGDRGGQEGRGGNGGQDWNRGNERRDREGGRNGGGQEYTTSQDGPQRVAPRGSFADSCSGSYVNQGRLYADCRDTRGNVRGTSIELGRCSSSDIGNNNGLLVCNNVRGDYEGRDRNNGGWDRDRNNGGWDRDRNNGGRNWQGDRYGRRDYGGFQNRWNQNDWRRDWNRGRGNDWWRNDRGFRGYTGFRFGYYFAPNYGYYSVPRNYFGQRWSVGSYLPSIFWRYSLNDYRTYGLGYPPPGTRWVAVDTTIYLIDSYDGYIIEVIYDAWRW